jgi:hypothetical protein
MPPPSGRVNDEACARCGDLAQLTVAGDSPDSLYRNASGFEAKRLSVGSAPGCAV